MPTQTRDVSPGSHPRQVKAASGQLLDVPTGWSLLPPGDAALSRRVKSEGPCWCVKEKRGRKVFSQGIWAPHERIERIRAELEVERQQPDYQRKLDAGRERRAKTEQLYAGDFEAAVLGFLNFDPQHLTLARRMARAVATHAVPVGSGTVARTRRIPIEERAEAAAIAWMRHQTTAYDDMSIPRVKGMRREVRRMLAQRSRDLLRAYREGRQLGGASCPLQRALGPAT
ncbi:MAG: hypothetical protein RL033_898 [Pseudomonadota bacterium]|jgi:hypothetical protein